MGVEVVYYLLAALLALLVWWYHTTRLPANFPPGPGLRLPFLGHMLSIGMTEKAFNDMRAKYGDIMGFTVGPFSIVVLTSYELIQEAMSLDEFSHRPVVQAMLEARGGSPGQSPPGLIESNGSVWSEQRRFTLQKLRDFGFGKQGMEELILEEVSELCRLLEQEGGRPIDIRKRFNAAILNALWRITTGQRLKHDDQRLLDILAMFEEFNKVAAKPVLMIAKSYPWLNSIFRYFGIGDFEKVMEAIYSLVEESLKEHEATFQDDTERDFLDSYIGQMRLQASNPASSFFGPAGRANARNVMLDLFLAGSDSTSITLNWATLQMANNLDVQKRVQDELDAVVGRNRRPGAEDRQNTPYTEAVIHEIHRHSRIVGVLSHCASQDVVFKGYSIPKGTMVIPAQAVVMSDPKNFSDPDRFDPDRFFDVASNSFVPNAKVIPFGVGKRRCLGETLVRTELYLFLAGIVHQFTILPPDDKPISTEATVGIARVPKPYKVKFVPRA